LARRPKPPPHDSSVVHELSWREREQETQRLAKRQRRRARWRPLPRRLIVPVLVLALVVAIGVVAAGYTGRGPYGRLAGEPAGDARPITTSGPSGTTSSTFVLTRDTYRPGDCVIWDQAAGVGSERLTRKVPCDRPHLIEVAGHVLAEDPGHYPTDAEWDAQIDRLCQPLTEQHLGAKLDPNGRYAVTVLNPTDRGWAAGDRDVWCALQANWGNPGGPVPAKSSTPFEGAVRDRSQHWVYEEGRCLEEGNRLDVPCDQPHWAEVTGSVTLPDDTVVPAPDDRDGWARLVNDACDQRARRYLGREPRAPAQAGWVPVEPASWAAGHRTVACVVGDAQGEGWATVTGSARGTAA
jgi:hypothetical protein